MSFQIIPHKMHKSFDKYQVGYDVYNDFYVYCVDFEISDAVFRGTGTEALEKLLDERFIYDVKRKITENGKSVGFKNRVWKCRKQERKIGNPVG